jgi:sterol desaturase/sphingolipid hydroxylase (fatty acid hydroxylase superfamily)
MGDHLDPSLVAIPFYVVTLIWEGVATTRRKAAGEPLKGYETRDTLASLGTGLVSVATVAALGLGQEVLAGVLFDYRLFDLGTGTLAWAVALLAWDFAYYWLHRWEHEIRFLWATHVPHHSSEHYNLSTALRQPWAPIGVLAVFPPIALLGVPPWMILMSGGFNLVYQYWIHTEAIDRMPAWFEYVFNTPSHHRVHHGSNARYLDKNHGGVLIVWDRLFGTFELETEPVVYGVTKNIGTFHLWTIFTHELRAILRDVRSARSWGDRLRYVFGPPGWAPSAAAPAPAAPVADAGAASTRPA